MQARIVLKKKKMRSLKKFNVLHFFSALLLHQMYTYILTLVFDTFRYASQPLLSSCLNISDNTESFELEVILPAHKQVSYLYLIPRRIFHF